MKTAVSIPDDIFKEVEVFAREHHYSRSRIFTIAVKEFIDKLKSREILETLNTLYADIESPEDSKVRKKAARHYVKHILKERY